MSKIKFVYGKGEPDAKTKGLWYIDLNTNLKYQKIDGGWEIFVWEYQISSI